jgi:excisionase family DNA binding protein
MNEQQTYFTKSEAAQYLRCSLRFIDYVRARNELKAYRLNRKLLFVREDLDAFARKRAVSVEPNRGAVVAGGD